MAIKINDGHCGQHLSERDKKSPNSPSKKLAVLTTRSYSPLKFRLLRTPGAALRCRMKTFTATEWRDLARGCRFLAQDAERAE
jgi:hypothetical protein